MNDMAKRVLVVEDEMTIAMMIEDMLMDLGHEVVATAARLPTALEVAGDGNLDFVILDVNLAGHQSFPVAAVLQQRGIPFAFATGYGPAGIDPAFAGRPVLTKPFTTADLAAVIETVG
jgi:CheY-like chemotaxis protein